VKRSYVLLVVWALVWMASSRLVWANGISFYGTTAAGVPLKIIRVDLQHPGIKISGLMTQFGAGHAEPFSQMVRRAQPTVAITGTFFSTRNLRPIGDIVIDGQLAHFGGLGTALCITENNEVEFIKPAQHIHQNWSRFDFVLCAGPRLVQNGVAYVDPKSEGFRDRHMLRRNSRLGVGITRDNHLLLVVTRKPVYLSRFARALRAIGVVDAINLDGGSSIGVYYKGKTLIAPKRKLTNLMVIYADRGCYEARKGQLLPIRLRSAERSSRS
jgi:hypothetical protein